jgi:hypothetical protein
MNEKERSIAKVAAEYCSRFIKDPSTAKYDNGSGDPIPMMLHRLLLPEPATDKELALFMDSLTQVILEEKPRITEVDYNPSYILRRALNMSSLEWISEAFPIKTTMYIDWDSGEVAVSEGYAAPVKIIHKGR